jgi:hypothetical protein
MLDRVAVGDGQVSATMSMKKEIAEMVGVPSLFETI